jgi:putative transcriptional regulator
MTPMMRARFFAPDGVLTQQQLADRVMVARTTITAIENGVSIPAVTLAIAIARELGTSVEALWATPPQTG